MILAIEILFLIAGVYAIITAKLPSWFVGKGFKAQGNKVRILGILMAAIMPMMLCFGIAIGFVGAMANFNPSNISTGFEIVFVILMAIIVTIVVRRIREHEGEAVIDPPNKQPLG